MLSGTSVLGAALASWGGNDGIARLKSKKEQPPRPLMKSSGFDPVSNYYAERKGLITGSMVTDNV